VLSATKDGRAFIDTGQALQLPVAVMGSGPADGCHGDIPAMKNNRNRADLPSVFAPDPCITYLATIEALPWASFRALPPHPAQRDTEIHAARLLTSGVLNAPLEQHREVRIILSGIITEIKARFAEDHLAALQQYGCKLDGHTRAKLGETNHWVAPETCRATIYAAETAEATLLAYQATDSIDAAKIATDELQSTLSIAQITLRSPALRKCTGLSAALNLSIGALCGSLRCCAPKHLPQTGELRLPDHLRSYAVHLPYLQAVYLFGDAIETLDAIVLSTSGSRGLPQGGPPYIAGWLTILKRDPKDGAVFLGLVTKAAGTLQKGEMDAVYVVHHLRSHLDQKRDLKPAQRRTQAYCGILNAYDAWSSGREFQADDYRNVTREAILNRFNPVVRQPHLFASRTRPRNRKRAMQRHAPPRAETPASV
jgi:hypothetical protein